MKKIIIFVLLLAVGFTSCEDITFHNEDPKSPSEVPAEYLFSYGLENLARQMADASYNQNVDRFWSNYLTQTTYIQESNYDPVDRDVAGNMFDNIYTEVLLELKNCKELVEAEEVAASLTSIKINKLAQLAILEAYSYQYLVDNFGNVPFSEALDIDNITPAYDDAATIYNSISSDLKSALSSIDTGSEGFPTGSDMLYSGDMSAWKKFGASILLKMGMRLSDYDSSTASALVNDATGYGVFSANDDNASFGFLGSDPYKSPVYDYFITQGRASDFVATTFFIGMLNDYNDPRLAMYFDDNLGEDIYLGGVYGAAGNTYTDLTHVSTTISDDPTYPSILMDYSAVLFYLAEAVERGFVSGDAEIYYNDAIKSSFDFWGLGTDDYDTYIVNADVAYDSGNYVELIGTQKYIASYNQGHEAWTEAKRLDVPELQIAENTNRPNPNRMLYPNDEDLINGESYHAASQAIGGDELSTKLFWDVN
ncbi:MAG: SusD/RagB family nutrient-binding outer membrane lipoprotein [Bacteroidota bacterium]